MVNYLVVSRVMMRILISWIGKTDIRAATEGAEVGLGPITQAVEAHPYDRISLIHDYPKADVLPFVTWLKKRTDTDISLHSESLSGPTNFGEIYESAVRVVDTVLSSCKTQQTQLTFHLSPGTPAMASVWIILAKTRFPADLIESSREHGVRTVSVPFDIAADFLPDLLKGPDERLERLSRGLPPDAPEFESIVHRSLAMKRIITKARRVAPRSVPVLIEGESGTGKEVLARAIHQSSTRRSKPFIAVNCGAIPKELVESELFGHEAGAFTGATKKREGYFEAAHEGTLFLDELGELPGSAQVKLLRTLQEGEVVRLGSTNPIKIDVRIIAATNRKMTEEIATGRFREDLFYRLAVAVLRLPPLRERSGDIGLLVDVLLDKINEEGTSEPGYNHKKLSASARNLLLQHAWPGNVRELQNTLTRAAIWSNGNTIRAEDIRDSLLPVTDDSRTNILNRPLGEGLDLPDIIANVSKHYLSRSLDQAQGNKTKAAELVGLPSYQTFTNWLKKYGVKE
jgi:DNA-binding NtrC family response regulator